MNDDDSVSFYMEMIGFHVDRQQKTLHNIINFSTAISVHQFIGKKRKL